MLDAALRCIRRLSPQSNSGVADPAEEVFVDLEVLLEIDLRLLSRGGHNDTSSSMGQRDDAGMAKGSGGMH